ncbi:MAG: O-antigen ligase family protein [Actinomycetota bacterium]|nr:O-antigen ligase family protein [Actinomycetota bacterium]
MTAVAVRRMLLRGRWRLLDWRTIVALPLALAASWLFMYHRMFLELIALLVLALPLLLSPKVRVLFFVLGTVTVFGPPEFTMSKLLFLFGASVALAGAFGRSRALVQTPAYRDLRPLIRASVVLMIVILVSFFVAQSHGVPHKAWLSDVAPYVLLAWAPLFAFDAQTAFGVRGLQRLIVVAGLEAAVVFMLRWYGNRGIASDTTSGWGLPSLSLCGALFALALAIALDREKRRLRWLALGAFVFAMVTSTGTRLSAVLLAAPLAIILGTRRHFARRSIRLGVAIPIAAVVAALGAQSLLKLVHANREAVSERFTLILHSGTASDQSYSNRLNEVRSAWALFQSDPVFGVGPGHTIPWRDANGAEFDNAFVDTPVGFLPDYGLVGVAGAGILVLSFSSVVRGLYRRAGKRTTSQLALLGFGAVVLAYSVLQVPFEDKGLSTALLLLLAISAREAGEHSEHRIQSAE